MPSADEIDLFIRSEGGSGDSKEDSLVVKKLQHILDMPEPQLSAFVKTRDRSTVHKLHTVLQDMPRTNWVSTEESDDSQAHGNVRRKRCKSASDQRRQKQRSATQARIEQMKTYQTAYNNHFGSSPVAGGIHDSAAVAFDGVVRREYQSDLEQWRKAASDGQVRVLAEACRSLRYFKASGTPLTSYTRNYPQPGNHKLKIPKDKDNSRNYSMVPLGAIYSNVELPWGASHGAPEDALNEDVPHKVQAKQRSQSASRREELPFNLGSSAQDSRNENVADQAQVKRRSQSATKREELPFDLSSSAQYSWNAYMPQKAQGKVRSQSAIRREELPYNLSSTAQGSWHQGMPQNTQLDRRSQFAMKREELQSKWGHVAVVERPSTKRRSQSAFRRQERPWH